MIIIFLLFRNNIFIYKVNPNKMPSTTTTLILCFIFIIICYVYYTNRNKTGNVTLDDNKVKPFKNDTELAKVRTNPAKVYTDYTGIYLYNPDSDNLYLKRPNPDTKNITSPFLYYYSGKGMDCPDILNNDNSSWKTNANSTSAVPSTQYILIQDLTTTVSCANITGSVDPKHYDDLLKQCTDTSSTSKQFAFYSTTADVQEKYYADLVTAQGNVTTISPHPNVCHSPNSPTPPSGIANDPEKSKYQNFADYLVKNEQAIIGLAAPLLSGVSKLGSVVTASQKLEQASVVFGVLGHFVMVGMILPGLFGNPETWEYQKNAIMGGQMVLQAGLEKLTASMTQRSIQMAKTAREASTRLSEAQSQLEKSKDVLKNSTEGTPEYEAALVSKNEAEAAVKSATDAVTKTSSESIMSVTLEAATDTVSEMSIGMSTLVGLDSILGTAGGFLAVTQIAGMIADSFDPCKINSQSMNITQDYLDLVRETYDHAISIKTKNSFPERFPPSLICKYGLDCNNTYNNCLSDDDKKKYESASDYCEKIGDKDLYNSYVTEYLDSLTVNSSGECIGKITNSVLANYFNTYVGGLDWSFIATMSAEDFILPNDKQMKGLNLLLADENVITASYIDVHFYYFLAVFVICAIIMFII
jgi:hypothetical protein